jgi:poly(A)-specific ribonuclease
MSRTLHWEQVTIPDLSSFDRRLVHQLVRAEYKDQLMTMGRRDCVIVKEIDVQREARYAKDRKKRVRAQIARQTGFRWIIQAITGGSLHGIDIAWFAKDPVNGSDIFFDEQDFTARFNRAAAHLKTRRPVLVGHNLFTDLIYLYHSFIGQLPDTVSEFRIRIHNLFPTIVDTKYLATHNCGNINPASSLEQIEETLRTQKVPSIQTHAQHTKYVSREAFHEAGYDSLLTARVMILLSANLEAAGKYVPEAGSDEEYDTAPEDLGEDPPGEGPDGNGPTPAKDIPTGPKRSMTRKRKSKEENVKVKSRFGTKTTFDALMSGDDSSPERGIPNSTSLLNGHKPTTARAPSHSPLPSPQIISGLVDKKKSSLNPTAKPFGATSSQQEETSKALDKQEEISKAAEKQENKVPSLMPPFECDFWRVYGNKLRIFGTEERVLDLDPLRMSCKSLDLEGVFELMYTMGS